MVGFRYFNNYCYVGGVMNKKKCGIEEKCPWGCKPVTGMWDKELNLYATNCILYTDCPRKYWTSGQWKRK